MVTRERYTLAGANADLRQTRQRLTAEAAAIDAKLDQSRERQRALLASTRSLKGDLAAQLVALAGQRRAVAALRTNRDALKGQADALVSTLDDTAESVVRATVGSRLASYSPKFVDLQTASYTYLLAPDAMTASAGAMVRMLRTYALNDLNEDDHRTSCPITSKIVLVGFEMTMSDVDASARLVDKSDPIMKRLCVVLPSPATLIPAWGRPLQFQSGGAMLKLGSKSLDDPKLAPVFRAFQRLDDACLSYLAATPMHFPSDNKPTQLLVGGKFRQVLPRLTIAQLTTVDFMQAREAVGQFNYQLYCSAATFSQAQHFVMVGADPVIDNCEVVNGWQTLARDAVSRMPEK